MEALTSQGLDIADPRPRDASDDIRLILGCDSLPFVLKRLERHQGVDLFRTAAGLVVWGPLPQWAVSTPPPTLILNRIQVDSPLLVDPQIEKLWHLDVVGITPEKYTHMEEQALDTFRKTTQYQDGRYTVHLPFKGPERPAVNFA